MVVFLTWSQENTGNTKENNTFIILILRVSLS